METAGKLVEDEELRDVLKENGIGRPSTRAAIIRTLYKRGYIRQRRKSLEATPTGVELIDLIRVELLKSAELTGIWENKLRQIERQKYAASQFIGELKEMVGNLVDEVMRDATQHRVTTTRLEHSLPPPTVSSPTASFSEASPTDVPKDHAPRRRVIRAGSQCPLCGQGKVIKGNTAYGCSRWREGCTWRKPFKK